MEELTALLRRQAQLLTRAQAHAHGVSDHAIIHRTRRPGGGWTRVLPGVYATTTGALTVAQQRQAALLYAGPDALLGGLTAAAAPGLRQLLALTTVEILVPHTCKRATRGLVVIHRSTRMPPQRVLVDGLPCCPVDRAVVDACRRLTDLRSVRALVAESVQRGRVGVADLRREVEAGASSGSALTSRALAEVEAGVRSAPEAELRELIALASLPEPRWNADLAVAGSWLARPDAWWPEAALVCEVDSREWHLSPADWERTMRRHNRMQVAGLTVLHVPPSRLRREPMAVLAELAAAYARGVAVGPAPSVIQAEQLRRGA